MCVALSQARGALSQYGGAKAVEELGGGPITIWGGGNGPYRDTRRQAISGRRGGSNPAPGGSRGCPHRRLLLFFGLFGCGGEKAKPETTAFSQEKKNLPARGEGRPPGAPPLPPGVQTPFLWVPGRVWGESGGIWGQRRRVGAAAAAPRNAPQRGKAKPPPDCWKRGKLPQKSNLGAGPPQGAFLGGGFGLFGVFSLKKKQKQKTNGVWGPVRFPGAKWAQRGRGWGQARVPSAKRAQKASFWVGRMPPVQNGLRKWGGWVRHTSPT